MMHNREQRHYPRVPLTHVSVDVYDSAGRPDKPELCFIVNISEAGMLFKTDSRTETEDYSNDKRVRLTFILPDNNIIIRIDAVIVHTRESELFRYIGVQFKNVGTAEQNYLKDFVAKFLTG